jgi:hypothetical protein
MEEPVFIHSGSKTEGELINSKSWREEKNLRNTLSLDSLKKSADLTGQKKGSSQRRFSISEQKVDIFFVDLANEIMLGDCESE